MSKNMINLVESEWEGYRRLDFTFEGRSAIVICPHTPTEDKKWLFKTEYFGKFPGFELQMLERGYHVVHIKNITRWCLPEDTDVKAKFAEFLIAELGLKKTCVPVGFSCGGMQAVYFAAKFPQFVSAMYIDAPVLNLLSCPCGVGKATVKLYEEFTNATGMTPASLINYRNHPIDHVGELLDNNMPVFLVCGDSDSVVPYEENGAELLRLYRERNGIIEVIVKPGCEHHPHGLDDNTPIINFVEKYYN